MHPRTLSNLPFNGNTPNSSRPSTDNPEIANVFADNPSVNINVHSFPFDVPASIASSKYGMYNRFVFFLLS